MSDRELLELAAKAAGIESSIGLLPKDGVSIIQPSGDKWNPITDDGDAFRLAVRLKLEIVPVSYGMVDVCLPSSNPFVCACEGGDDPYAATRRAIVRAAAEIGRSKA